MDSICIKARAKINLSLDVLGKREDGYHDVRMIMQSIGLHDKVFLEAIDERCIKVTCDKHWVPTDCDNIAYKAAAVLMDKFDIPKGISIRIVKKIPVAAGLAGGSADAAAVLKGMNDIFSLNLKEDDLMQLGKSIGADIPFCIKGGTMLAEGIGEVLTEIEPLRNVNIVLVKPRISVSTAWVYKNLEIGKISSRPDTELLINLIEKKDIQNLGKNMVNVLEAVTINRHRVISEIKEKLVSLGALGSMMSGSGPTVFGVFGNRVTAEKACKNINRDNTWECILTETFCEER
ncbi:4-(cytidine 5'-diphospho)-2-C-methyl-D-erythritol kinase [Acetivibrio cellulolyticus]|uniref:4-(cytidine 5'-diphospho)-2-C-methyl-D-erythritol kinase n=1 Tax=Acetivibrio cellulolyticus TaxID=35830 RepID=UPI0001E2F0C6|nr:4-(cytidine 5'-diphospho)-2-C-methyl-D-erythritol kinase [Acetivibrio cellulolyticus]